MEKFGAGEGEPKGNFVSFGSFGVFGNVGLVRFEIFYEIFSFGILEWDLAKNGKSGAHTAFVGDIFERWIFLIDIVTHLVGESDKVELAIVKFAFDD